MRTMNFPILVAMMVLTFSGAQAGGDISKAELKKMEGIWQLQSAVNNGKETPREVVGKIRVIIKNGKHTVQFGEKILAKEIPFTVDPAKNPKTTTDTLPDGKKIKGIYKLEGDRLTSCVAEVGKDRPSAFDSKSGSGHTLRVFQRIKE